MGLRATQCILNGINRIIMDKLAPRPLMFAWTDGKTDGRTDDGRTDIHSKFGGYNIIPRHTKVAGYKKPVLRADLSDFTNAFVLIKQMIRKILLRHITDVFIRLSRNPHFQ